VSIACFACSPCFTRANVHGCSHSSAHCAGGNACATDSHRCTYRGADRDGRADADVEPDRGHPARAGISN